MTRLLNTNTFQQAFGTRFNSPSSKSVFRFAPTGGDGQAAVSAGYAQQSPSVRTPASFASGIANLQLPTYQAQSTWQAPENMYQSIVDSMTAARQQQPQGGQAYPQSGGGSWGQGTGKGLGLAAYGFKGTTGLPEQRGTGKLGLQQVFSDALDSMFAEMKKAGLGVPSITDGFRSYQGQVAAKQKWQAKGKPQMAATPGRSVHGLGLAADLGLNTAQFQWMKRNAAKFGIVNLPSESWHWQYDPAAWTRQRGTYTASRQVMA